MIGINKTLVEVISYINEIWLPITENVIPNIQPYYEVSNYGRIRSIAYESPHLIYIYMNGSGYLEVRLSLNNHGNRKLAKTFMVHRIVLATFNHIEGWQNLDVNHKDNIRYNDFVDNLEWMTHIENLKYAYNNGSYGAGESSHNNILTEKEVIIICNIIEHNPNMFVKDIYNLIPDIHDKAALTNIYNIRDATAWYNISKNYNFLEMTIKKTFSEHDLMIIYDGLKNNKSYHDILIQLGYEIPTTNFTRRQNRLINLIDKIDYDLTGGICYLYRECVQRLEKGRHPQL